MADSLYIQHAPWETRAAVVADGRVLEFEVERTSGRLLSGNIYRGRVDRVVPSMDAAFVDIGLKKMALLSAADVWTPAPRGEAQVDDKGQVKGAPPTRNSRRPIGALIQAGAEIMVQVVREPVAKKGPRATMMISLPGRNLVFLPQQAHIGVSRMIADPAERRRLHEAVEGNLEAGTGAIVRTVGEGATEEELSEDLRFLREQWRDIGTRYDHASAPSFLFADLDLVLRALRDLVGPQTEEVWIDDPEEQNRIETFLERFHPGMRPQVRLHEGPTELFAAHGLDRWIREAVSPTVALKSGGQLILQRTEGMTVIDVNSSRQVGGGRLDNALLKLNLEAAREIALQLRLRNIGGLIVVDFVDMPRLEDRRMLGAVFEIELSIERTRVRLGRLSPFGVVELTRKRVRESAYERLTETCPTCAGQGYVRSASDLAIETISRLRRAVQAAEQEGMSWRVQVPARVAAILNGQLAGVVADLAAKADARIDVVSSPAMATGSADLRLVADAGDGR